MTIDERGGAPAATGNDQKGSVFLFLFISMTKDLIFFLSFFFC
jgi:hypothetical protein